MLNRTSESPERTAPRLSKPATNSLTLARIGSSQTGPEKKQSQIAAAMLRTRVEKKKRSSITDSMKSDAEKILSGAERGKIKLLDSDMDRVELSHLWPDAPTPCVVPVNSAGFNYVFKIKERLKAEGFFWDARVKLWFRPKLPGQLTLAQKARSERNRAAALEKLAKKRADEAGRVGDTGIPL